MLPQLIDVNACYSYHGHKQDLRGEHGIALGFVDGEVQTLVLFGTYNERLDKMILYHVYAFELDLVEECECDVCKHAAYGLIRKMRECMREHGIVYCETIEQTRRYLEV